LNGYEGKSFKLRRTESVKLAEVMEQYLSFRRQDNGKE